MKRLPILLSLLLSLPILAQSPGTGLDSLPLANAPGGGELMFSYQAGSGGSGVTACTRGWCPVDITPALLKAFGMAATYQSGPNEGTPSGVRYEQMVALLVKAVQEQQHEIDGLKRQLKRHNVQ